MFNNKIIANNVFVVVINSNNKKTNNNRLQHLSLDDGQCFFISTLLLVVRMLMRKMEK